MDLNNVKFDWISYHPKTWKISRVKHHFSFSKDTTDNLEGIPILSLTLNGIIERNVLNNEGQLPESYNGYTLLKKGDIVFNPMDLNRGWVDISNNIGLISPSYRVIRSKDENINVKFFTYFFQRNYFERIFFPFGEGVHYEYRWGLGKETLKNFPILLPPINEQEEIVDFLDTKINLIQNLKDKLIKRENYFKKIIPQFYFYNKKSFEERDLDWFQILPKDWEVIKLKEFFEVVSEKNFPNKRLVSVHQKKGVIYRDEQKQNVMNPTGDLSGYKLICKGDFVISLRSFEGGFEFSEIEGLVSPVYTVLRPKFKIDVIFYKYLFKSDNFITEINRYITGIREGKNINFNEIKDIKIPVPKKYNDKISEIHQNIFNSFKTSLKKRSLLEDYKQSLISEVITGKRKVTN